MASSTERSFWSLLTGALRRRVKLIVGCCLVAGLIAFGLSLLATKTYTATASLLFRDPGFSSQLFGGTETTSSGNSEREAATNLTLVKLPAVDELAAEKLGNGLSSGALRERISVSADNRSNVVSISVSDSDPEVAARIANVFATSYVRFRRRADRAKITNAIGLVNKRLIQLSPSERASPIGEALANQSSRLATLRSLQTGNAELVQRATVPSSPSSPKTLRTTLVAAVIGLLLGVAAAILLERTDRRLRSPDEFEEVLGMPILTAVPESSWLDTEKKRDPENGVAAHAEQQAFQMLRTRLRYFNVDRDVRVVLVTSASPGDGKSTTAWETAIATAGSGGRALLIEAELHRATTAARYGLKAAPGLSELLTHQTPIEAVKQSVPIDDRGSGAHVDVITAGSIPPNPTELVESDQMRHLLATVREEYDLVVIDTPPALIVPDAIPLMKLVDGVIIIGRVGNTTRDEARRLKQLLDKLDAPTLGVVANRWRHSRRGAGAYGYYYAYTGDNPANLNGQKDSVEVSGKA
jgi:capsular exopolysaccharide synthesis family protein